MPKRKLRRRPRTVKVRVMCGGPHCMVKPGLITVKPGTTIAFQQTAGETVYIQASEIGLAFKIKKTATGGLLKVPKKTPMGIYPYAVFCYEKKAFCTGSSMPIIIVPRC